MESRSESLSEEFQETEGSEKEEIRELEKMTTQPESVVEERGNIEEAEAVETVFVELVDNLEPGNIKEGEEEGRIQVKAPTIDREDEGIWSKVEPMDSGEGGSFFRPETEDEEEYSVKVKFPWLLEGDEDREDFEANWVRVGAIAGDGNGAWFMPDVGDEVLFDPGEDVIPPSADIRPVEDTGGDESLRVSGEEIKPAEDEEDNGDS